MVSFNPQHNGAREWQERSGFGWVFEYSQWKKMTTKIQRSTIKHNFSPTKRSETSWTNQKHVVYLWWMNEKERESEREYMSEMFLTQNCGVALHHHHGVFKLCELWVLSFVVCVPEFICSTKVCILCMLHHIVSVLTKKGVIHWMRPPLNESAILINLALFWSVTLENQCKRVLSHPVRDIFHK